MALFKKKTNEYDEASNKLNEHDEVADHIIMEQIEDDDEKAAHLVDFIRSGTPVVINFEKLDPLAANKMLAFFAGAAYALDGKSVKINETTYLFARRVEFLDGSLQKFVKSLPIK